MGVGQNQLSSDRVGSRLSPSQRCRGTEEVRSRRETGPSSPDDSYSSPIDNMFSSPGGRANVRRQRRSSFTPLPQPSRFVATDATPTPSSTQSRRTRRGGTTPHQRTTQCPLRRVGKVTMRRRSLRCLFGEQTSAYRTSMLLSFGECLDIDAQDVYNYDSDLYTMMIHYPLEVLAIFDIVLMDLDSRIKPLFEKHIQARIFNLRTSSSMRNLNPSDIEKMVSLIIRCSSIIPEIREAVFRCLVCGFYSDPIVVDRGLINEPTKCGLLMHDKLVDAGKPGDRVEVTGIYRAMSVRVGSTQRTIKSLFKTYVDCLHLKKTDKSRMRAEDPMDVDNDSCNNDDDLPLDYEKKVEQLKELAKQPDIYDRLTRSLAPSIWELDDLPSGASFRGDINILLVGDPGTSKSQLLQYIHKLSPRGIYTSGRGSSAVGLTAYVAKDPETGETVLESGALVLSDKGICCVDEFDKMSDSVMEQQTVSIAKAGIIASLNARTSVLACANPSGSRYNPRLSVIENIHLPPTLLSRFDLIYLILDKADEQTDRRLAKHIVALHFENPESIEQDVLDLPTLTAYVSYARTHIHPQLSDEAAEELTKGYVEMRRRGNFPGSSKKVSRAIDMDLITTGISASERMKRQNLLLATRNIIMEKMEIGGPSTRLLELLEELKKQSSGEVHLNDLRNALSTLASEDGITVHGDNVRRI
ncbi:hypothetical protein NE237_017895 [Protea cynaroides]|uniref:DNA helicase n=1 Tax=Protea cynaroides TaxID=273540 RepID=A0A9Q0K901_9MAGN|nr:hypothetical protein NE237_017895 [Protea cynaroides]